MMLSLSAHLASQQAGSERWLLCVDETHYMMERECDRGVEAVSLEIRWR